MNLYLFYILHSLAFQSPISDRIIAFIAGTADKVVLVFACIYLVLFFLIHKDWKRQNIFSWIQESAIIGISVCAAWLVSYVIKITAQVPRPFVSYPEIVTLIPHEVAYDSFPSGHATVFFALAMAIYLYDKKIGIVFFVFAVLIAVSRVIVGVHYPIDIFIGAIIGIVISKQTHKILTKYFKRGLLK